MFRSLTKASWDDVEEMQAFLRVKVFSRLCRSFNTERFKVLDRCSRSIVRTARMICWSTYAISESGLFQTMIWRPPGE